LGGILCGVFGLEALGGMGGVGFMSQLVGTLIGVVIAVVAGFVVYGALKASMGIRLSEEDEFQGPDLALHKISATPEEDLRSGR
jgi:Amt family ammonium transporter